MGILTDYFRAADEQDALRANDFHGGPLQGADPFDGIEAKGIEPLVVLAKLVALIRGTEWSPALVDARQVSPEDPEAGSGILELDTRLRDDLAALPADRMDSLAADWARIEELSWSGVTARDMLPILTDLVALAQRARDAGQLLYCWISL